MFPFKNTALYLTQFGNVKQHLQNIFMSIDNSC